MISKLAERCCRMTNIWSIGIYEGDSPFQLRPASNARNPVISIWDVTDVPSAGVADPFLVFHDERWYMFFEMVNALSGRGEIAYATSRDGLRWTYRRVVLREPFHLSYPCITSSNGSQYMVPESHQASSIRLYEATDFPAKWVLVKELLAGSRFIDPSIFFRDGTWWMYAKDTHLDRPILRLFCAKTLLGEWNEHPESPVVCDDLSRVRPGGKVLVAEGKTVRFAQDCSESYGRRLRAFRVDQLSRDHYEEDEILLSPELRAQGRGWNAEGMHHIDAHRLPSGRWVASVDGCRRIPAGFVRYRRWMWRKRNDRCRLSQRKQGAKA